MSTTLSTSRSSGAGSRRTVESEIIPFGAETTRVVHGAGMGVLYYQRGLRSAFFHIKPGQHINADPKDQTNPFPSLFIVTGGRAFLVCCHQLTDWIEYAGFAEDSVRKAVRTWP